MPYISVVTTSRKIKNWSLPSIWLLPNSSGLETNISFPTQNMLIEYTLESLRLWRYLLWFMQNKIGWQGFYLRRKLTNRPSHVCKTAHKAASVHDLRVPKGQPFPKLPKCGKVAAPGFFHLLALFLTYVMSCGVQAGFCMQRCNCTVSSWNCLRSFHGGT